MPDELDLLLYISFGKGMSFVSLLILLYGFSDNHFGSVSESNNLFINELFAPFSSNLLTKYGSKSL